MPVIAKLNYLRISPRKIRLVADLIRGLDVTEAKHQLRFLTKKGTGPLSKLLNSAVSNAQHNFNLDKNNLYIAKILVNQGPTLKRWRPRAFGRAFPIAKRTSHITLVLEEKVKTSTVHAQPKVEKKKKEVITKIKEGKTSLSDIRKPPSREEKIKAKIEEKKIITKPKPIIPSRPYDTSTVSKKRFFSRQTFGNIKKAFRRKSV